MRSLDLDVDVPALTWSTGACTTVVTTASQNSANPADKAAV